MANLSLAEVQSEVKKLDQLLKNHEEAINKIINGLIAINKRLDEVKK